MRFARAAFVYGSSVALQEVIEGDADGGEVDDGGRDDDGEDSSGQHGVSLLITSLRSRRR